MKKYSDDNLFRQEQDVLQHARSVADLQTCSLEALLSEYRTLTDHYEKLLKLAKKVFRISDNQGKILHQHQSEIQNLLDNANQGFLTFGADLKVGRQFSAECQRIFGKKIGGLSILELLSESGVVEIENWRSVFEQALTDPAKAVEGLFQKLPDIVRISKSDIRIECKLIQYGPPREAQLLIMMVLTDITEKLKAEKEIRYLSYHDKLTGLYNRAYVEKTMGEYRLNGVAPLSVVVIDMNGLKIANDVLGHEQGDQLLVKLARILEKCCRQSDVVARWGGDEFILLLPGADEATCQEISRRIRDSCAYEQTGPIQLSAAIGSATKIEGPYELSELFSLAENKMYANKLETRNEVRAGILADMEKQLYERCFENPNHHQRLQEIGQEFAAFCDMDLNSIELKPMQQLAILHDIGKIAIAPDILGKPAALSPDEWQVIRRHSEIGYRMAQSIGDVQLAEIILAVHERWDGQGYPNGLIGAEIPLLARIFAIIDAYDVMTHERPYAPKLESFQALKEIIGGRGMQFDPGLVDQFALYLNQKQMTD